MQVANFLRFECVVSKYKTFLNHKFTSESLAVPAGQNRKKYVGLDHQNIEVGWNNIRQNQQTHINAIH